MNKFGLVWTPDGVRPGPFNSLVGKGESIINFDNGEATKVRKGTVGVDNQPSSVTSSDNNVIAGNDIDWIGYFGNKYNCGKSMMFDKGKNGIMDFTGIQNRPMTFAQEVSPYVDLVEAINNGDKKMEAKGKKAHLDSLWNQTVNVRQNAALPIKQMAMSKIKEATDRQLLQHMIQQLYDLNIAASYAKGKDTYSFSNGSISPFARYAAYSVPALINGLLGLSWIKQDVHAPNIYAGNPYENQALDILSRQHANPYNQWRAMLDAERRGEYAINQSGGYNEGQRQLARVAQNIGLLRNYADVLAAANKEENQYAANYATNAANLGAQRAARMMQANQYNQESYDRAASRRLTNFWKSMVGLGSAVQQGAADENMYNQFQDMMKFYNAQLSLDLKKWLWNRDKNNNDGGNASNTASAAVSAPVSGASFLPWRITPLDTNEATGEYDSYGTWHPYDVIVTPFGKRIPYTRLK